MYTEKLAKDLMHSLDHYPNISADAPILEALKQIMGAMDKKKPLLLVVVGKADGDNNSHEVIKGFITHSDLVFGLASHFLKGSQTSGPIFWEGQFEMECLAGIDHKVEDIMSPIKSFVHDSEMIMESIFLLNKHHADFLPVVRQDSIVGILHLVDILKEIGQVFFNPGAKANTR